MNHRHRFERCERQFYFFGLWIAEYAWELCQCGARREVKV